MRKRRMLEESSGAYMRVALRIGLSALLGAWLPCAVAPPGALGCSCGDPTDAKTVRDAAFSYSEGLNSNKIIFEGIVEKQELQIGPDTDPSGPISSTEHSQLRVVLFRILHTYRGERSGHVTVLTGSGDGDCGFDFATGSHYLVYADKINANFLHTSICSGTSLSEHAEPALRLLRGE